MSQTTVTNKPAAKKTTAFVLNTCAVTMTAMLAAISYILAFVEFPVPLSPSFAKMDLSDFPALIGAFAFGPVCGVMIELVKNALQMVSTSTGGVGEFANFLMGGSYVLTAGMIYKWHKTKKMAMFSCVIASIVMGIVAALANYFILLPLFETFMPLDQLIASFEAFIPFIHTKLDVVLYNAFPFNLLKGLVIGAFTMLNPSIRRLAFVS
ncbi:MAG: ECF transporter S component [Lachnospiraceae bacterium]|nr:ECF transporter S component [Lachnospiraceae bacterium]